MDFNFDRIISDQFDWTIVDKALHDEVVRLRDRITALENGTLLTVAELANVLIKNDISTSCPFCSKLEWDIFGGGEHMHDDDCPFAVAYSVTKEMALQEPEANNEMDAKTSAIEMAQSLGLDDAIRTVAKSGRNHDRGPNWYACWDNLAISATFGAGTNSATVSAQTLTLYSADDFGRRIKTFRYGPWVHRLIAHAKELRQANEAHAKNDEATKAEAEAAKFQKVDF